jgi:hypothetical protein
VEGDTPVRRLERETGGSMAAIRLARLPAGPPPGRKSNPYRGGNRGVTPVTRDNFRIVYITENLPRLLACLLSSFGHAIEIPIRVRADRVAAGTERPAYAERSSLGAVRA